jgi:hypothetical protein
LEDSSKGRLLSIKETQTLARKDEILDEIAQLEVRSIVKGFVVVLHCIACVRSRRYDRPTNQSLYTSILMRSFAGK